MPESSEFTEHLCRRSACEKVGMTTEEINEEFYADAEERAKERVILTEETRKRIQNL